MFDDIVAQQAAAEARGLERRWRARRVEGELDDARLVDALTGTAFAEHDTLTALFFC